jgi:putative ABC transport system permease protein
MNTSIQTLSFASLAYSFIPVLVVIGIIFCWQLNYAKAVYALSRMLIQLLLIGYVLAFIFSSNSVWIIAGVLIIMVLFSSWIALNNVSIDRKYLFIYALLSILIGGGSTLFLIILGVLDLEPWYSAQYLIPLAGMIFANAMNSISLAAERLDAEIDRNKSYQTARNIAFNASLIPIINSLFAVGLVSLPGMMTGQILSGVSPFIAARYQIMVMCMLFGSAGISSACFLTMAKVFFLNKIK